MRNSTRGSLGLILGPGAAGAAQSHLSTHLRGPQGCSWFPSKGQGPQHTDSTGFHFSCFRIPPGMLCSAPGSTQSCGISTEPGSAHTLPAASCIPQRAARTRTSQEKSPWMWQQRWSHPNQLRPRRAVTLPTHPHPLWAQPSARARAAGEERRAQEMLPKCWQMLPVLH